MLTAYCILNIIVKLFLLFVSMYSQTPSLNYLLYLHCILNIIVKLFCFLWVLSKPSLNYLLYFQSHCEIHFAFCEYSWTSLSKVCCRLEMYRVFASANNPHPRIICIVLIFAFISASMDAADKLFASTFTSAFWG